MITISHKFRQHQIDAATTTLIIGTFNPDTAKNTADFFYSRNRNYLWRLLPIAFGQEDLKGKSPEEKRAFMQSAHIDFIDLIETVTIEAGQETNYADAFLDSRVTTWRDVIAVLQHLKNLRKVCLTRKSFADIPTMKIRIDAIRQHCLQHNIYFQCISTPTRFYTAAKQQEWRDFFNK
ncbi:hypothetical protein [Chitinophaga nivalis]|uniref:DNA-deoxyinosine glycosylase n=1 Tax=Chitinophaga nivalis TaxID=2991709 RepID=A0ABT3IFF4_9BACT|nr:hypothetical protein [Chitinophaga nivalis]MCW3467615.1 hypothetical protein [Chitinophaga nivalis]MCW3482693.1 hypothetical protein [Chitinophaga nivalis]